MKNYILYKNTVKIYCNAMSTNYDLSATVQEPTGYKFLCWDSLGRSDGWVSKFPSYVSNPATKAGFVWYDASQFPSSSSTNSVLFAYYLIRNV